MEQSIPETAIAHVASSPDGGWRVHRLEEHLASVGRLAARFATVFGGEQWAGIAGTWHDLGKFNPEFQNYIRRESGYERERAHLEGGPGRVDHSTAGAIHAVEALGLPGRILAYLIAGHHAGLPDWEKDEAPGGSLRERLQRRQCLERTLAADIPQTLLQAEMPLLNVPGGEPKPDEKKS